MGQPVNFEPNELRLNRVFVQTEAHTSNLVPARHCRGYPHCSAFSTQSRRQTAWTDTEGFLRFWIQE